MTTEPKQLSPESRRQVDAFRQGQADAEKGREDNQQAYAEPTERAAYDGGHGLGRVLRRGPYLGPARSVPTFLQLLDQAAGIFNRLAPDLPPLMWSVSANEVRGQVDADADDIEAGEVLTLWADRLGLALVADCLAGAREYAGVRAEWQIVVWGVTDKARWTEDTRRAVEAYGLWNE
jgi:hypothetical protein